MTTFQSRLLSLVLLATCFLASSALPAEERTFDVKLDVVHRELSPSFCWFHPRVAAIPNAGKDGQPAVILTIQKHLAADDHYSGLFFLRTNDLGQTWTGPTEIPELAWGQEPGNVTIAVADVTPLWHAATGKLIAIGTKVRYSAAGGQLLDKPRSHECAYAMFDPQTNQWSKWKFLELPATDSKFFLVAPGCVQWLVKPDDSILLPVYFRGPSGSDFIATVLHCSFDGETLRYQKHGDELAIAGGRGFVEPSLAFFRGKYLLTLRNDARGYVTSSDDGLKFAPPKPWQFDDGKELGSYNTQQHWLTHGDSLFLAYTRRGANNDHIARNRAPLFLAQVDPDRWQVIRSTEQVLIPERGVMLGNFGAAAITASESWVTDAEFILADKPHARGADGSVFAARVRWAKPDPSTAEAKPLRIITLGDSITKGARSGVAVHETFAAILEAELKKTGRAVEVLNVGIGGERTDGALARLDRDVIARQPIFVTIMYGTNDSYVDQGKTEPRLTRDEYRANLQQIVERLKAANIQPVLMTEPRWGDAAKNGVDENPNIRLEPYLVACREVAKEFKLPIVDHFTHWTARNAGGFDIGQWTTDQCHPNPIGHRVLAASILNVLRENKLVDLVQPLEIRKVFADGKHNAFTGLRRFRGDWWLAFRSAKDHNSGDGDIVVLRSKDAKEWREALRLNVEPDDRDPQFLATDKRLFLYDMAMRGPELTTYVTFTDDGETWSKPQPVYEPRFIVWKPIEHNGRFYSAAHKKDEVSGGKGREVHLITSEDGLAWKKISTIRAGNWESETTLHFSPDHRATAFLRQKYGSPPATILESTPPYAEWIERKPDVNHFSGHSVHTFRGVTYLLTRTMDYSKKEAGSAIYIYSGGKLTPYCRLPSGGDCAYLEAVEDGAGNGGNMLVSYYSSHEGSTNIYLATVPLQLTKGDF